MSIQKYVSDSSLSSVPGLAPALGGVVSLALGGVLLSQVPDFEEFGLLVGYLLAALGLLGIVAGGVAVGIQMARGDVPKQ